MQDATYLCCKAVDDYVDSISLQAVTHHLRHDEFISLHWPIDLYVGSHPFVSSWGCWSMLLTQSLPICDKSSGHEWTLLVLLAHSCCRFLHWLFFFPVNYRLVHIICISCLHTHLLHPSPTNIVISGGIDVGWRTSHSSCRQTRISLLGV